VRPIRAPTEKDSKSATACRRTPCEDCRAREVRKAILIGELNATEARWPVTIWFTLPGQAIDAWPFSYISITQRDLRQPGVLTGSLGSYLRDPLAARKRLEPRGVRFGTPNEFSANSRALAVNSPKWFTATRGVSEGRFSRVRAGFLESAQDVSTPPSDGSRAGDRERFGRQIDVARDILARDICSAQVAEAASGGIGLAGPEALRHRGQASPPPFMAFAELPILYLGEAGAPPPG
jgi:hypothetical protein